MVEVYFVVVALEYWALMTAVAAADAAATPVVITVSMALESRDESFNTLGASSFGFIVFTFCRALL